LSSDIKSKNLLLFEVTESLAEEIENGQDDAFVLKGEELVLTTKSHTYQIRHAETSNTFLICSDSEERNTHQPSIGYQFKFNSETPRKLCKIEDSGSIFFEVLPCKPRFDSVFSVVPVYSGSTSLVTNTSNVTIEKLLEIVPCSSAQLLEYLNFIHVVELNGFVYRIDIQYVAHVLELVLLTAQEQESVSRGIIQNLEDGGIEFAVLNHVYEYHTNSDDRKCTIDEAKTCRTLGHALLLKQDRWGFESFLTAWQKACFDLDVQLSYLEGLFMLEEERPRMIKYFSKDSLSSDPKSRMQELFKARPKWKKTDMLPFLTDLGDDKEVNSIFLKYARESKANNDIYLTSKYVNF
jgi:sister chromatid cohesion protein DCC1